MKHKRPCNTIKTFMEHVDYENLHCPKCNNKVSKVKKCLKCGSTNLFEEWILD